MRKYCEAPPGRIVKAPVHLPDETPLVSVRAIFPDVRVAEDVESELVSAANDGRMPSS